MFQQFPPRVDLPASPQRMTECSWGNEATERRVREEIAELRTPAERLAYLRDTYLRETQPLHNRLAGDLAQRLPWRDAPTSDDVERAITQVVDTQYRNCVAARRP